MEHFVVTGGNRLEGEVSVSGSKNAALAIIPAAICTGKVSIIENLPNIKDVRSYLECLNELGAKCEFIDATTLRVDSSSVNTTSATFPSVGKIRASYYLLGALLGRFKKAEVSLPGGCNLGSRPFDLHIKGFEALGATVKIENGTISAYTDKLIGANIYLDVASVGATINIMFAAIYAEGVTVIENAAKEPHIVDTANFLNILGANIKGAGTNIIRITGVKSLGGAQYTIIPDQIEAGTYMIAAAITRGNVKVRNLIPQHMESLSAKLSEMNCIIEEGDDFIRVVANDPLQGVNIKTQFYPGFPTDLQPQMTTLLTTANGTSRVTEVIFENRFQYVNELKRFGANVKVEERVAIIEGCKELVGTSVTATDLRAGASLIIAALIAKGKTKIGNIKYIDRGYENIEQKLTALGADIERTK